MIRNEVVKVTVGGVSIYPKSVSITSGVGRGYNTCSLDGTNLIGNTGDVVIVTINNEIHTFILDEKSYGRNTSVSMTCYGEPFTLEDYSSLDTIYTYTSSDELISTECGLIPFINNIPNISFENKSYSKDSTSMSRILDMVKVVGGEAYEVNGTLYLDEIKTITTTPTIAYDFDANIGDVFDFSYLDKRDKSLKTKEVLLNPIVDTLTSTPSSALDFEEASGTLYFNPSLSQNLPYTIEGLVVTTPKQTLVSEKFQLSSATSITTMGGIDTVVLISLNGIPMTDGIDYVAYPSHNIIRFTTQVDGEVVIQYNTIAISVYATQTTNVIITYQCSKIETLIEIDADNIINSGDCYGELIAPFTYEDSSYALTTKGQNCTLLFIEKRGATNRVTVGTFPLDGGGSLLVEYLYDTTDWTDVAFMSNISSLVEVKTEVTTGTVYYDSSLLKYVVYLDKPILQINDIYFGNSLLSGYTYNVGIDAPYIEFLEADNNKAVDISYDAEFTRLTIPPPLVGHPVTLLDMVVCSGVASISYTLAEENLCSLPATFKVDVAGSFNKEITEVKEKTLTGDFGNLVVDSFGKVEVTVTAQGVYTIICDALFVGATITVDSQGVI